MKIERLNWDTDFFGIKIGRTTIFDETEFNPVEFKELAKNEEYELVYVFKFDEMIAWDKVLKADLELVDAMVTMSKKLNKIENRDVSYDFRTLLSLKELNECYSIAEQTSIVSRFYREEKIGDIKTRKLYKKWIDNALEKIYSDGIFLEYKNGYISGIHLIKTDMENRVGYFTLTGVNQSYKRSGIGQKLWTQSFGYWSNETNIDIIKSPFSFQNLESFNFHLKMGFNKLEEIKYIYHYRNNNI